jgi:DNA-binding Lrp family transcriptional regulator
LLPTEQPGDRRQKTEDRRQRTDEGREKLDEIDERILAGIEGGLEVVERPYDFLCADGLQIDDVLSRIDKMISRGVIHRVGAVVDHHKLGFVANAMFVCEVKREKIGRVGEAIANLSNVSHCYQRKTFDGWPYNLFAMMHGRSLADIRRVVDRFVREEKIRSFEVLATVEKLRK